MLIGYPPFCSDTPQETYRKIINWKHTLKFPDDCNISANARDLIEKLCCDHNDRLGKNGADEIKHHPFFKGFDWNHVREMKPPIIPELSSITDTHYFDKFDPDPEHMESAVEPPKGNNVWRGFTFKSNAALRRLTLGTWGRGGTLKFFKSPFEEEEKHHQKKKKKKEKKTFKNNQFFFSFLSFSILYFLFVGTKDKQKQNPNLFFFFKIILTK